MRPTISTKLTIWYGFSLLLLLSLFVVFLYSSIHVGLHQDLTDRLEQARVILVPAIDSQARSLDLSKISEVKSASYMTDGPDGTYIRLLSMNGGILDRSPNYSGHVDFTPIPPATPVATLVSHSWEGALALSRYTPLVDISGVAAGWLEITRLEVGIHRDLHRLKWLLAAGVFLGLLVAVASGYGLSRRLLRPVAALTEAAKRIQMGEIHRRLPTDFAVEDELTDLAETFNAMLERLEASFEQERRFRADAAHELFSPISAVRSEVEVALLSDREGSFYRETLGTVSEHMLRMGGIVDDLLQLSTLEAGRPSVGIPVNLSDLVAQRLDVVGTKAEASGVALTRALSPGVFVSADAVHLATVVDNLVDNALKFTPGGGNVHVSVRAVSGVVEFAVADSGIGFDENDGSRMFNRFYRSDSVAVKQTGGHGLGLSISRAIVQLYGGHIGAMSDGVGSGSTIEVRLPVVDSP